MTPLASLANAGAEREVCLRRLATEEFDVLVIGGGATGAGAALDAASRGLSVALIERGDFAVGTSSRSTKLLHGGVRYLEQAVKRLDRGQFDLVRDALRERWLLLRNAPHLTRSLRLMTPLYAAWEAPYYVAGLKLYDLLAGRSNLEPSRWVNRKAALHYFPSLKAASLHGAVEYHDGQFDDARMNIALAITAKEQGAVVANYVEALALIKKRGVVTGVVAADRRPGPGPIDAATNGDQPPSTFEIRARVVINAAGPFVDAVRRMDEAGVEPMLEVSSGTHVVLPGDLSPPDTGLLIPKTEDGRVLFLLPWLGHTLVGTTDHPAAVDVAPRPTEEDIEYILRHLRHYFEFPVERSDILAAWSGLRPLVRAGHHGHAGRANADGSSGTSDSRGRAVGTASISRDHTVVVSEAGLVTITGGKWTTYRRMAKDAIDAAVRRGGLAPSRASATEHLMLAGGENYDARGAELLVREFGLAPDQAAHLNSAYGSRARQVALLAQAGFGERLVVGYPYIEAEVLYAASREFALTTDDVLGRRIRLSFLNEAAAAQAKGRVEELLVSVRG